MGVTPDIQMGTLEQIKNCHSCDFCQFLAELLQVEQRSSDHHPSFNFGGTEISQDRAITSPFYGRLPTKDNEYDFWNRADYEDDSKDPDPELHISYEVFVGKDLAAYLFFYGNTFVEDRRSSRPTRSWRVIKEMGAVDRQRLRPDKLLDWIRHCEESYGYRCSSAHSHTGFEIYLIDLEHSCIIETNTEHRYLALSYVSGGHSGLQMTLASRDHLLQEGSLNDKKNSSAISQAVKDTMALTISIGERFLWVDSMCIVKTIRKANISNSRQ